MSHSTWTFLIPFQHNIALMKGQEKEPLRRAGGIQGRWQWPKDKQDFCRQTVPLGEDRSGVGTGICSRQGMGNSMCECSEVRESVMFWDIEYIMAQMLQEQVGGKVRIFCFVVFFFSRRWEGGSSQGSERERLGWGFGFQLIGDKELLKGYWAGKWHDYILSLERWFSNPGKFLITLSAEETSGMGRNVWREVDLIMLVSWLWRVYGPGSWASGFYPKVFI